MSDNLNVICYSGFRADESPLRFFLGERKIEVTEVIDRWMGQDHQYFKVIGDDAATYILRHNTGSDTWELTMFDCTGAQKIPYGRPEN